MFCLVSILSLTAWLLIIMLYKKISVRIYFPLYFLTGLLRSLTEHAYLKRQRGFDNIPSARFTALYEYFSFSVSHLKMGLSKSSDFLVSISFLIILFVYREDASRCGGSSIHFPRSYYLPSLFYCMLYKDSMITDYLKRRWVSEKRPQMSDDRENRQEVAAHYVNKVARNSRAATITNNY